MTQKKPAWKELERWSTVEFDSAEVARQAGALIVDFEAHSEKYTAPGDPTSPFHQWFEHPAEFGRAPDHLELYDHCRLFWPPTNDERDVWLFRYRYEGDTPEEGVGMVGSDTFALFGEVTAELPPDDIYALHCVWEFQQRGDKRAPKERMAQAGRKLLGLPAR